MANVVDKYPLSPIQQGILFHSLYSPESGVYMVQTHCVLQPVPDVSAFERTWNEVIKRHDIFRTAFEWKNVDDAVQVLYDQAEISLAQLDWRDQSPSEQRERLQEYLMTERMRGFDFASPPLMRMALIRLDDESAQFIWTIHHLLIDTWSETLLFAEASAFYRALYHGDPVNGEPAPAYRDYIKWIQQQDLTEADTFWRRTLKGFQAPAPLGARRTRSQAGETFASQQITLSSETTAALQTLARQQRVTLNTVTQGAWALLLSHYSGDNDVVFGVTVSGRPFSLEGAEYIIGPFLNTLPMRVPLPPDATLSTWLQDVQMRATDLLQFEYSPLVRVQGLSEVQPGLPLFESIYVFQSAPVELLEGDNQPSDSTLSIRDLKTVQNSNYPLALVVTPGRQLSLQVIYDSSAFTATTTARMLEHLRNLLAGMIAQPTAKLFDLPLLSMPERHELLYDLNQTERSYPAENVAELFREQAQRRPEALAVADDEQQWSYDELERRSNQLAHHLRSLGVGPEVRVGILLDRSCNFVLAVLAVIKAGGAYVPMDPKHPAGRIRFMLGDVGASVLLTETRLAQQLTAIDARVVLLDRESVQAPSTPLPITVTDDHLAYVIYTSGSTGEPKGVAVPHGGLRNLVRFHLESYPISAEDRASQVASQSFDGSVWELWPCLAAGASLHIPPASALVAPPLLLSWLAQREITISFLPTPLAEAVLAEPWPENFRMKYLCAGGDRLHVGPGAAPCVLVNVYGPTENSVVSTSCVVENDGPPIGRPLPNTKVYVLDQRQQPVPVGVTGELYLSGAGLARGYWQRPALTAERFVPHPFSERGGERMYRTGDLVRYRPDGQLEFIGRADNQVKLRGFRIELGEIEAELRHHPQVREAVVELQQRDSDAARLVGYVVPNGDSEAIVDELRNDLREHLPEYMVPSTFVLLPELPLNANGKVDRRALAAIGLQEVGPAEGFVALRTQTEMILAAIWAAVLHCENVAANDNFFELGGHSLLAMRLVSKLRETFNIELPLRDMLEAATLAEMARAVDAALRQDAVIEVPAICRRSPEREAPLSFAQQRLWLIQNLEPKSTAYNVYNAIRIRGPLNVAALEKALNEIVRRHEILRTTFTTSGDQLVQIVTPPAALNFTVDDLRSLPGSEQETEAQRLAIQEAQVVFDLKRGPLFRVRLLRLDDEHVLITCRHHIVFDVWSQEVFTNELIALYEAFDKDRPSPLSELPVQYADFACWERDWLQGDRLNALLRYWKRQLEGVPAVLNLPVDRPASAASSYEGKWQSFTLDRDQTKAIRALSQAERVTVYMVLVAAFKTFVYRYSGQSDFLIGTPVTSRPQPETDSLIGCFMNMLVLRTGLSGNPTFRELLGRVRETVLGAYTHQEMPFERLVEELKIGRAQTSTPLVQVLFSHVKPLPAKKRIAGLEFTPIDVDEECAKADWMMLMVELGDEIVSSLQYRVDLFDDETIRRAMSHFENLFHSVLKNPDARLDELEMLSQQEQIVLNQEIDVRALSRSFSF